MNKLELLKKLEEYNINIFRLQDIQMLFPDEKYLATDLKRLTDNNYIIRLFKGQYALLNNEISTEEVAQKIYYPSYVSFQSALFIHGIVDQGPNQIFLATTNRQKALSIFGTQIQFNHIKPSLYFGYVLDKNIFMATPEKAVCDMLYLNFALKIETDIKSWYLKGLDFVKLQNYLKPYGKRFNKYVKNTNLINIIKT